MVEWEGINDASRRCKQVWLSRFLDAPADAWRPLRKYDCRALSEAEENVVFVEAGRATANILNKTLFYNFVRGPERQLCSATWFVKRELNAKEYMLVPVLSATDAKKIELHYQKAVQAVDRGTLDEILTEEIELKDESKVRLVQSSGGGTVSMMSVTGGWFGKASLLMRGYEDYSTEGEDNEYALGPVRHCIFVVHGVGEALFSRDDVKIRSIIQETDTIRLTLQRRQVEMWKADCLKAQKEVMPEPLPPNRIELLPIEWYNRLHDAGTTLMKSLQATTLPSIPVIRSIANDVIFDVLMYLTPNFCEAVLKTVTEQVQDLHSTFTRIHPDFERCGGRFSFIGHSLGSVIVWDLLSILRDSRTEGASGVAIADGMADQACPGGNKDPIGTWGPTLTKRLPPIKFEPACTILLGSPLGMFLSLRGAHGVFDEMRNANGAKMSGGRLKPLPVSPFKLPTGCLFNIFNPNDPVAYRLEPLLLPQDTDPLNLPSPKYLTAPGQDVRFHLKAKQFSSRLSRSLSEPHGWWNELIDSTAKALKMQATLESENSDIAVVMHGSKATPPESLIFALGGRSARVDYCFQPGVVDSEYLGAVLAHATTTYFKNTDFQEFLLDLMKAEESTTARQTFWENH